MAPFILFLLLLAPYPHAVANPVRQHVRAADRLAQTVLSDGLECSPTVERLVDALEQSHLIVYVRVDMNLRLPGALTFMAHGGDVTYVLIRLRLDRPVPDRIGALAHELTHAVEVADADPPIASEADLATLYRRIGRQVADASRFESDLAGVNGRTARREAGVVNAASRIGSARRDDAGRTIRQHP